MKSATMLSLLAPGLVVMVGSVALAADVPQTVLHVPASLSTEWHPNPGLVQGRDGHIYGTTQGINSRRGSVFRLACANASYGALALFTADELITSPLVESPQGGFYGTIQGAAAGPHVKGGVFKVAATGKIDLLFAFTGANGANPQGPVALGPDGTIYGTTAFGGADVGQGFGTVWKLAPDTGTLTTLYDFGIDDGVTSGAHPRSRLVRTQDGDLYGTTTSGGQFGGGTVFRLTSAGQFSVVAAFPAGSGPHDLLRASDGTFYGRAFGGLGRVFSLSPSGAVSNVHAFVPGEGDFDGNPGDGRAQGGGLLLAKNGKLYGVAERGGVKGHGTVWELATDGTFAVIYNFSGAPNLADGSQPWGLLEGSDGHLYGTYGGGYNSGGVFKLTMPTGSTTPALCPPAPPAPDAGVSDGPAAEPVDTRTPDPIDVGASIDTGAVVDTASADASPAPGDDAAATGAGGGSGGVAGNAGGAAGGGGGSSGAGAGTGGSGAGGPPGDAGVSDAAADAATSKGGDDGCGCRVGSHAGPAPAPIALLLLLGLALAWRRRGPGRAS